MDNVTLARGILLTNNTGLAHLEGRNYFVNGASKVYISRNILSKCKKRTKTKNDKTNKKALRFQDEAWE